MARLGPNDPIISREQQEHVAERYERAPSFQPEAVPAWKAMAEQTKRQFDHLTTSPQKGGEGITVGVKARDPYVDAGDMFRDVGHNRNLDVLATKSSGEHPVFSNDENDMFRAVHDYYGHFKTGRGFDRHGEEAAYQAHAKMYTPDAVPALATETRGQNAAFITREDCLYRRRTSDDPYSAGTAPSTSSPSTVLSRAAGSLD